MRKLELGRIHAMSLAIRPLTYPAFKIRGCSRLVLNESTDTTGAKHRRRDELFSHRIFTNNVKPFLELVNTLVHSKRKAAEGAI